MAEQLKLEEVPRISLKEAKGAFDRGDALFVDVRGREDYEQSHIPGAISLPLTQLFRRPEELPRDRQIIVY